MKVAIQRIEDITEDKPLRLCQIVYHYINTLIMNTEGDISALSNKLNNIQTKHLITGSLYYGKDTGRFGVVGRASISQSKDEDASEVTVLCLDNDEVTIDLIGHRTNDGN